MRKTFTMLCAVAALAVVAAVSFAGTVRISQVYSGGGSSNVAATYTTDYIELFNASASPAGIGGWALEYGSSSGNWGSSTSNYFVFPAGTVIQPCSYLLVVTGTAGTGGAAIPVAANFNGNMNLGAGAGKVGLFNALNSNLPCGSEIAGTLEDKVGWGTGTAICPEGTAVAALSISTGAVRNNGGMDDSNNNSADFTVVSNPVPRNAASGPSTYCLAVPAQNGTWGRLKSIYR